MGLQSTPAFISQVGYQHPAELLRNFHKAIAGNRSGILRYPGFEITGTGVSNQIQITSGQAIVLGNEAASQGAYFAWSDATELMSVPAANGGNPRIDTLLLRIADPQYGTISGLPRAYWEVVQGTAAGSPTVLPDSTFNVGGASYQPGAWLRVADIRRNVGDTTVVAGRIYPSRLYARVAGRVVGNSSVSTTGFGGPPADGQKGDTFYELDTGITKTHDGTSFVQDPSRVVSGPTKRTSDVACVSGGNETLMDSHTFTKVAGHKYMLNWIGQIDGGENMIVSVRYAAGASVTTAGTLVDEFIYVFSAATGYPNCPSVPLGLVGLPDGQVTVGVFLRRSFGSGSTHSTHANSFVTDLGY